MLKLLRNVSLGWLQSGDAQFSHPFMMQQDGSHLSYLFSYTVQRALWLLLLCVGLWSPLRAQTTAHTSPQAVVSLDNVVGGQPVGQRARHWTDTSGTAGLADAQAAFAGGQFVAAQPGERTGPVPQAHWVRVEVQTALPHGDWMLALHTTAIDEVAFFGPFPALSEGEGKALAAPVYTGLSQPYASRPLGIERPAMRLRLDTPGRHVVYLRLLSRTSQSLEVSAWDTAAYVQSRQHKRLFDGITYGILLALLAYNLVLAFVFRREGYGLYTLTCAAALFTLASFNGHVAHYLLGSSPWWQLRANTLGAALWILFSALFCRAFLELPLRMPRLGQVFAGVAGLAAVAAGLALAGQTSTAHHGLEVLAVVGSLLAAGAASWVWRQGSAPAGWYLSGQAMLFLATLGVVGVNWGLLNAPFLLANGLQIGVVAEMLVFAYAMSARVRIMRQRQNELRREAAHLTEAVATDALTGLANRVGLARRAQQLQDHDHAVMLLDLDRFKPVNDEHGHEAGDRLLIEIARRLQGQMREVDLVARLGGDEFVVLLAGAHNTVQLTAMARRLVDAVHQPVQEGDLLLRVDASIGIACCPAHGRKLNELLRHADAAMYRAKQSGSGFAFYEPAKTVA